METTMKLYDKNGTLLKANDLLFDERETNSLEEHYGEYYIVGKKDMWRIEEFALSQYKDGVLLGDFEKVVRK